jgi:hypothetical protein
VTAARVGGVAAAFVAALLGACAQQPLDVPVAPPPPMIAGQCDDAVARLLVGQVVNEPFLAGAKARTRAERMRVVRPGDMVTMEFDAQRLTLDVSADGKVVAARCG